MPNTTVRAAERLAIAILADPLETWHPRKDSTLALVAAALRRGHRVHLIEPGDLWARTEPGPASDADLAIEVISREVHWNGATPPTEGQTAAGDPPHPAPPHASRHAIHVDRGRPVAGARETCAATRFDAVLVRTDPPFDLEYIYATYWLERLEAAGVVVMNRPRALRDWNEKAALLRVPELAPPTLVTRQRDAILAFQRKHGAVVLKPLDGMGGRSIFQLKPGDPNTGVILDTMLDDDGGRRSSGRKTVMAQAFLPAYTEGDRRVLIVAGEPQPLVLNRIPAAGESRANLAAGGRGVVEPLSDRDRALCAILAPQLVEAGLDFVGLDVIGGHVTEINVTSPTGLREILRDGGLDIAERLVACVEQRVADRRRATTPR